MAAAILNHHTAAQALTGTTASPMAAAAANGASSASSAASDSATISANDFLTLLVTELKNQDPTANTDPNEYINQLVNVNSLEELISINQTLTTALGSSTTAASSRAASAQATGAGAPAQSASPSAAATLPGALNTAATQLAPGNLGIPAANPAAQSVASSLSGRPRVQ
ncbi:MAG: flagellar hook capping FlgD N-terminal domain-containing protein [Terracidiphilus sp.]